MVNNHLSSCNSHQFSFELLQHVASHYEKTSIKLTTFGFYVCSQYNSLKKEVKTQQKHPWCKNSSGQDLKKGRPRPPAVDEIKIFDYDDKAAKCSFSLRMFCGLVIIINNFNFINFINSRRPQSPNSISHLFHPSLF